MRIVATVKIELKTNLICSNEFEKVGDEADEDLESEEEEEEIEEIQPEPTATKPEPTVRSTRRRWNWEDD